MATETECFTYRLYDADDVLLYVGVAGDVYRRMEGHKRTKAWFGTVARLSVRRHASRSAALAVENEYIRAGHPRHNIHLNGGQRANASEKRRVTGRLWDYWCDNLRSALFDTGLSQTDLARLVGAQQPSVNRWCTGMGRPSWEQQPVIARVLRSRGWQGNTALLFPRTKDELELGARSAAAEFGTDAAAIAAAVLSRVGA